MSYHGRPTAQGHKSAPYSYELGGEVWNAYKAELQEIEAIEQEVSEQLKVDSK